MTIENTTSDDRSQYRWETNSRVYVASPTVICLSSTIQRHTIDTFKCTHRKQHMITESLSMKPAKTLYEVSTARLARLLSAVCHQFCLALHLVSGGGSSTEEVIYKNSRARGNALSRFHFRYSNMRSLSLNALSFLR